MPSSRDGDNKPRGLTRPAWAQAQQTWEKAQDADAKWRAPDLRPNRRPRESAHAAVELMRRLRRAQISAITMRTEAERLQERLRRQLELARHHTAQRISGLTFLDPYFFLASDRRTLLASALDAALRLTRADMGNVQLCDPASGALQIEAQRGFAAPFLEFFAGVHDGQAACGLARIRAERVIVADVAASPIFVGTSALDVMLEAGARAVQSTPLIGTSGRMLGVLSTHYRRPRRPTEGDLHLLDVLARRVARWIEWRSAPPDLPAAAG